MFLTTKKKKNPRSFAQFAFNSTEKLKVIFYEVSSQQHCVKVKFGWMATWSEETANNLKRNFCFAFRPVTQQIHQALCKNFFKGLISQMGIFFEARIKSKVGTAQM